MEQLYQDNKDDGLMVITVLTEDEHGDVPDAADCTEWAEGYGATHPILGGSAANQWFHIAPISAGIFGVPAGLAMLVLASLCTAPPGPAVRGLVDHIRSPE